MLTLSLLGHPTITLNDQPVAIKSVKARALFFYLVCEPRPHSRQSLAGLLWGDSPEETARTNLRNQLTKLRAVLGDYLIVERRTIAFDTTQPHSLDLSGLTRHDGLPDDDLATIAATYRDDFLHDFLVPRAPDFELWQLTLREQLRQQQATLLRRLAHSDSLDVTIATQFARQWVALNPLEEAAHARTIALLIAQGNQAEAQQQLASCRKLFAEELGIEISAETAALLKRGGQGDVETRRTPSSLPSSKSPQLPSSLPAATTRFIGRQNELARLSELLAQDDCRLLTIVGMGGMGKTRLSLELARQLEATGLFPDGVGFVELAGSEGGQADALLLPMIEGLGIRPKPNQTPLQAVQHHLRNRKFLLVLDNFEHLVEQSDLLVELLTGAPGLKLVTTSRRTLRLYEEWVFELEGLDVASDESTAYELFVHRAQRIYLNFQPTAHQAAIGRICRLMEGMPLGIELAASWTRMLTCAEIADRLTENIAALQNSSRNTPARHLTMQAVFDHSWALLTDVEQELMGALSVFRGGFTLVAARAVADADARALSELLNRSLLRRMIDGRYLMHELVRQFSAESINSGQTEKHPITHYEQRHSDYFSQWMDSLTATIRVAGEGESITNIITDIANVRSGFEWAVRHPEGRVDGYNLMLQMVYLRRSWYADGCTLFADAIANLTPRLDDAAQQKTLGLLQFSHAEFMARLGQKAAAVDLFNIASATLVQQSVWFEAALTFGECASALIFSGDFAGAQEQLDLANAAASQSEDDKIIKHIHYALGMVRAQIAMHNDDWEKARDCMRELLVHSESVGHARNIAVAHNNVATAEFRVGNNAIALEHQQKALSLAREMDEPLLIGIDLKGLSDILLRMEKFDYPIEAYLLEALEIFRDMAALRWQTTTLVTLGDLYCQLGEYINSEASLNEAMAIADAEKLRPDWLNARFEFGRLQAAQNKHAEAIATFQAIQDDPACSADLSRRCAEEGRKQTGNPSTSSGRSS